MAQNPAASAQGSSSTSQDASSSLLAPAAPKPAFMAMVVAAALLRGQTLSRTFCRSNPQGSSRKPSKALN